MTAPAASRPPDRLVTGEAVPLDLRVAGLPSRLLAGAIDLAVVYGVGSVLASVSVLALAQVLDDALLSAVTLVLFVAVVLGYLVAMEVFNRGRTLGKMALGLRVVRDDGGPVAFRQALTREVVGAVVEKPGPLLFLPAVLTSLVRADGKRIGDVAAGTLVISDRVVGAGMAVPTPVMPPGLAGWAAGLDLSRLPDDVALRAREVLSRASGLAPDARERLGGELVAAVAAAVGPVPPGVPGWAYLSAVLAERHRRDTQRLASRRLLADAQPQLAGAVRHADASPTATGPQRRRTEQRPLGMAAYDLPLDALL